MIVAVLLREVAACARVQEALRGYAAVRLCEKPEELLTLVAEGLAAVCVLDLRDRTGQPTLPTVHAIRERFPSVPIVAYVHLGPDTSRDILALARAGVNDLILRGVDDVGVALRSAITTAQDHCAARDVLAALGTLVPQNLVPFLDADSIDVINVRTVWRLGRHNDINQFPKRGGVGGGVLTAPFVPLV